MGKGMGGRWRLLKRCNGFVIIKEQFMKNGIITPKIKSGKEKLKFKNKKLPFELLDYWKWSSSNLLSNTTRGIFAEFLVATATGVDLNTPREEWAEFDLITPDGIRIEVKSAAFIQTWEQKDFSKISFSIKSRNSDVYVMCLLKTKDQKEVDVLDLNQWIFYVLSIKEIENYKRSKHSITLKSLEKLTKKVKYDELNEEVREKGR